MKTLLLVCDSGPLIILAKLGVLNTWLFKLVYDPVVVDVVVDEVRRGSFAYGEEEAFEAFLKQSRIVPSPKIREASASLSTQDLASLSYAEQNSPAVLFADDRLLRRAAKQSAVPVIGFPGLIIQAVRSHLVSKDIAIKLLDQAIKHHDYRISISLYQELRKQIENL